MNNRPIRYASIALIGTALFAVFWFSPAPTPTPGGHVAPQVPTAAARGDDGPHVHGPTASTGSDHADESSDLTGVVLDVEGHPVASAEVYVVDQTFTASSAPSGEFRIAGLLPGHYGVFAQHGDEWSETRLLRSGTALGDHVLVLRPKGTLTVRVIAARTGEPIKGAVVRITSATLRSEKRSDDAGRVQVPVRDSGWIGLVVEARSFATVQRVVGLPAGATHLAAEEVVAMAAGAHLGGRVVDAAGSPVRNVQVRARRVSVASSTAAVLATSAEDGQFAFSSLEPGHYQLDVSDASGARGSARREVVVERENHVMLRIAAGLELSGRVVDTGGNPVSAVVEWQVASAGYGRAEGGSARSDEHGAFQLRGLPQATCRVQAFSEAARSKVTQLDPDSRASLLLVLDDMLSIVGKVVADDGAAVVGALVTAEQVDGHRALTNRTRSNGVSDTDGKFVLAGLSDGTYFLTARAPSTLASGGVFDSLYPAVRARAGQQDVRLTLDRGGSLHGMLELSDGSPPGPFRVYTARRAAVANSDGEGRFSIGGVPAGTHEIAFAGPHFAPKSIQVTVRGDTDHDLGVIRVDSGRKVAGVVLDDRGSPVAAAHVVAAPTLLGDATGLADHNTRLQPAFRETWSDADGKFELWVQSQQQTISAEIVGGPRSRPQSLSDTAKSIVLRLERPATLDGLVRRGDKPVTGALVSVAALRDGVPTPGMLNATSGIDGHYVIERVPPGTVLISAAHGAPTEQQSLESQQLMLVPGEVRTVNFDLPSGGVDVSVQLPSMVAAETARVELIGSRLYGADLAGDSVAQLRSVQPGRYLLCRHPVGSNSALPERQHCREIDISATPLAQRFAF